MEDGPEFFGLFYNMYACLLPDVFLAAPHDEPLIVLPPLFFSNSTSSYPYPTS